VPAELQLDTENGVSSEGFGDGAVATVTSSNPSSPLAAELVTSTVAVSVYPSVGL